MMLAILASIGALRLVRWLWLFFMREIKKEVHKPVKREGHASGRNTNFELEIMSMKREIPGM